MTSFEGAGNAADRPFVGASSNMSRVSLIVPWSSEAVGWPDRIEACQAMLAEHGLDAEVLVVIDPSSPGFVVPPNPSWRAIEAQGVGLSQAAVSGIRASRGQVLIVIDLAMDYSPEDVLAVARQLDRGGSELAVACRPSPWTAAVARRVAGTTDPASGLIGLTRDAADRADQSLSPVGSRFAIELLAKVEGRRADVPIGPVARLARRSSLLGDVKQIKRLADDRFGNASRLLQFCFVGASGMVVDLTCYATFQAILARTTLMKGMVTPVVGGPLTLAASAILSITLALTWNFSINRRLTFNDARRGSIARQFLRYVLSNLLGIGVSLTIRLLLPNTMVFFRRHHLAAAVVGIVAATGISFSMARWFVFGARSKDGARADRPAKLASKNRVGLRASTRADQTRTPGPHMARPSVKAR